MIFLTDLQEHLLRKELAQKILFFVERDFVWLENPCFEKSRKICMLCNYTYFLFVTWYGTHATVYIVCSSAVYFVVVKTNVIA